jgi:hypothetical protein
MGMSMTGEGRKSRHLSYGRGDKKIIHLGADCEKAMRRQSIKNEDCSPDVTENKRPINDKMSTNLRCSCKQASYSKNL